MRKHLLSIMLACSAASSAMAGSNYVVVLPAVNIKAPVESSLTLSPGALPDAIKGELYSESLNRFLRVTGDQNFKDSDVAWALASGALPVGMVLTGGTLSGTPTEKSKATFEVLASYKDKTGQQTYSISVGGRVLEVRSISLGAEHSCAVTTSGGVKCWGYNSTGALGNNSTEYSPTPVDVWSLSSGVALVTAGTHYTCALTTAGGVKCWGYNAFGQLGNHSTTDSLVPVDVAGLTSGVSTLAVRANHTCVVTTNGGAKCWGMNYIGQLGNNSLESSLVPVDVVGLESGVAALALGVEHSCALTTAGGVKCWGIGGRIGDNSRTHHYVPTDVVGLSSGVTSVVVGTSHSCAVTTAGQLKCWGEGTAGQLGNGAAESAIVPVDVVGLTSGVAAVALGELHSCALTTAGGVKCWGFNDRGQVGTNDNLFSLNPIPADVVGLNSDVTSIAAGYGHTCAVITTKEVKCWGRNSNGQLGDGSLIDHSTPKAPIEY